MQSKRHTHFSRVSTTIFIVVTIVVVVWLVINISGDVHNPLNQTSNPSQAASTTMPAVPAMTASTTRTAAAPTFKLVQTPKGSLRAEVAATDASRERGLSNRASLSKDSGMLFVFPHAGIYGFWMKDMQFPLDIVWIGADQKVVGVAPGVSPGSFPEIFYPSADILYVLELPSGSAAEHAISVGTLLAF